MTTTPTAPITSGEALTQQQAAFAAWWRNRVPTTETSQHAEAFAFEVWCAASEQLDAALDSIRRNAPAAAEVTPAPSGYQNSEKQCAESAYCSEVTPAPAVAWALVSKKGGIKKMAIERESVERRQERWLMEWPNNGSVIRPLVFGDEPVPATTDPTDAQCREYRSRYGNGFDMIRAVWRDARRGAPATEFWPTQEATYNASEIKGLGCKGGRQQATSGPPIAPETAGIFNDAQRAVVRKWMDGGMSVWELLVEFQAAGAPATAAGSVPDGLSAYDPNFRWGNQRVRLTLKQWDYSATLETTVGGNCHGYEIFKSAIDNAFEALPTRSYAAVEYAVAHVILTNPAGETLEVEDEELKFEDWLKPMVTSIEIIGQEPGSDDSAAAAQSAESGRAAS